jgi:hypothetical protein
VAPRRPVAPLWPAAQRWPVAQRWLVAGTLIRTREVTNSDRIHPLDRDKTHFFHARSEIVREQLTLNALGIGLVLAATFIPLRIAVIALHRRIALKEAFEASRRIGSAMVPTLVFTLVIVGIMTDRFGLSSDIAGGLVLYTILNTLMPAFVLHAAPADFEDVEALPIEALESPG